MIATPVRDGMPFHGFAPEATIVPIRVVAEPSPDGLHTQPADLAADVNAAIDSDVHVIAVSVPSYRRTQQLQSAVGRALARGVTVVAAVGDLARQENRTPYPAAYHGVIGVGAIDRNGIRWDDSQYGDFVGPHGARRRAADAAGRWRHDAGDGHRAGVRHRRRDRCPGPFPLARPAARACPRRAAGHRDTHRRRRPLRAGRGEPYAAVTSQIVDSDPAPLPSLAGAAAAAGPDTATLRTLAVGGAAAALFLAVAIVVGAIAIPRGRRRHWRGTLAPRPSTPPESDEPRPPVLLFSDRAPTAR